MRAALFPLVTGIVLTPGAAAGLLAASNPSGVTGQGPGTARSLGNVWKVAVVAVLAAGVAILGLVAWFGHSSAEVSNAGDAPDASASPPASKDFSPTAAAPTVPSPAPTAVQLPQPFAPVQVPPLPVSEESARQRAAIVTNSGTVSSTTEAAPPTAAPSQTVEAFFGMEAGSGVLERDISVGFSLIGDRAPGSGEVIFSLPENATFIPGKFSAPAGWSCSDPVVDSHRILCTIGSIDPARLTFTTGVSIRNPDQGATLNYQLSGEHIITKSFANGFH